VAPARGADDHDREDEADRGAGRGDRVAGVPVAADPPAPGAPPAGEHGVAHATAATAPPPGAAATNERNEIAVAPPPAAAAAAAAPRGALVGRLLDPDGAGVCPARVYALPLRDGKVHQEHVLQADADADGRFAIEPTFDGEVLVAAIPLLASETRPLEAARPIALHRTLLTAGRPATIARDRTTDVGDLVAERAVTITGRVHAQGHPVDGLFVGWRPRAASFGVALDELAVAPLAGNAGVHVDVTRSNRTNRFSGGSEIATDGTFTIAARAGQLGHVSLRNAAGANERLVAARDVTAPAHVEFALLAPVCVRIEQDGLPVPDREVELTLDVGWKEGPLRERYRTDARGELRVHRERYVPLQGTVQRPARPPLTFAIPDHAEPASPLVVELGAEPTVALRVTATAERGVGRFHVSLQRLGVRGAFADMTAIADAAVPTLGADVPPGRYWLHVAGVTDDPAAGNDAFVMRARVEATVTDPPQAIALRVEHGGRIRFAVTTPDGQRVPGVVRVRDPQGRESTARIGERSGGFGGPWWASGPLNLREPLAPGRYEVIVDHGARGVHRELVDVRPCEVADVAITLR
jgi:hypothetical protein